MKARVATAIAVMVLLAARPAAGASVEPSAASADVARAAPAWFAVPVAFYMPETRLGFGGIGGVHFDFDPALPTSDVQLIVAGTVKRQAMLDLRAQLFPSREVALGGAVKLSVFPDLFYGIGDDTPSSAREAFTVRFIDAQVTPERYVVPGLLRTGPRLWLRIESVTGLAPGGALASGAIDGVRGYATAGLGWGVTLDSRDNRFSPRRGRSVEAWYVLAPRAFGDGGGFGRGALDARQFLPLGRAIVLGFAAHLELSHGAVPFTLLPRLGGDQNLRGYYLGRWRDRFLCSGQAEARFPVAGRLGAVVFAGLADVAARPSRLEARTLRPAAGAGGRFRLTRDGLAIRLDVGAGQEGANVYASLGEAF